MTLDDNYDGQQERMRTKTSDVDDDNGQQGGEDEDKDEGQQ